MDSGKRPRWQQVKHFESTRITRIESTHFNSSFIYLSLRSTDSSFDIEQWVISTLSIFLITNFICSIRI